MYGPSHDEVFVDETISADTSFCLGLDFLLPV